MPTDTTEIIGQILSIIATLITIFSLQLRAKKSILIMQIISTACLALSYFLLGAMSGFALNVVGIIRNVCFYLQPSTGRVRYFTGTFFCIAMSIVGVIFWQGPADLLIIIALAINAMMLSVFSAQALRYSLLFTCVMMIAYAMIYFNVGAILNESLSIVSSAIGILRYRSKTNDAK